MLGSGKSTSKCDQYNFVSVLIKMASWQTPHIHVKIHQLVSQLSTQDNTKRMTHHHIRFLMHFAHNSNVLTAHHHRHVSSMYADNPAQVTVTHTTLTKLPVSHLYHATMIHNTLQNLKTHIESSHGRYDSAFKLGPDVYQEMPLQHPLHYRHHFMQLKTDQERMAQLSAHHHRMADLHGWWSVLYHMQEVVAENARTNPFSRNQAYKTQAHMNALRDIQRRLQQLSALVHAYPVDINQKVSPDEWRALQSGMEQLQASNYIEDSINHFNDYLNKMLDIYGQSN